MGLCTILAVDSDSSLTRLLRRNLEGKDTRVIEARSGLDCLKALHEEKVDLILLDLKLPDFNGWGILSLLRLTESLHDIPIIAISVEPPNQSLVGLFSPEAYVQKPFDTRELLVQVMHILERIKANRQGEAPPVKS